MAKPAIVNIINFIRGLEPRDPDLDLVEPLANQLRLVREHDLPASWLIQYDALIDPRFRDLLREQTNEQQDIGIWFEVVQPQVERAGLPWRGRFPWDWHTDVGFSVGYTPEERERLVDVIMEEFYAVFGRYPKSFGSWLFDAHVLQYAAERYGIIAACNCRDQWGTDGYTMWGGYYSQAYYPSKRNAFMPAQHAEEQIPVPVFRMLGSDPIYQYDARIGGNGQAVVTLEPVYPAGGGDPRWVRWFFDVNSFSPYLAFSYCQVGQENPFGWPSMAAGLTDQIGYVAEQARAGRLRVETLAESGRWFREQFPVTPATAVTALTDWQEPARRTVWYDSRYFRTSLVWEDNECRIRDIRLFDERYTERYLTEVCTESACTYDTLPIVDGLLWSDEATWAGMTPVAIAPDGTMTPLTGGEPSVSEVGDDVLHITWPLSDGNILEVECTPQAITMQTNSPSWGLRYRWCDTAQVPVIDISPKQINYRYENFDYQLALPQGNAQRLSDTQVMIKAEHGKIVLQPTTV